jgi:aminopeptidase-like protein
MNHERDQTEVSLAAAGRRMFELAQELFPLHRSITGNGVRKTLDILAGHVPLKTVEVPSGSQVLDWEVPQEWNIRDAYIADADGNRLVDYQASNLHVVNYSQPIKQRMRWGELKDHLTTLPEQPDWIPYRTAYFRDLWGFCLTHRKYLELDETPDREVEVCIDATFEDGALSYGELCLQGELEDEVLISTHICHPSLANDNLSGIVVANELARRLATLPRRYTYRFIFVPATIGAITWLHQNRHNIHRVKHGLVLSGVGNADELTYKRSRLGNAKVDRAVEHVLRQRGNTARIRDFAPTGYDERQFCSPGFNLPMGCLMRSPNGEYPEYHTSADNLEFLSEESLADTVAACLSVVEVLEHDRCYVNKNPFGEPQLGRRGLYRAYGEQLANPLLQQAILWVLNLSDSQHGLLDVAERSEIPFDVIKEAAGLLERHELIARTESAVNPTAVDSNQVWTQQSMLNQV